MNRTNIAKMLLNRRATVLDPSNVNQNALPRPPAIMLNKMKTRQMWTNPPKRWPRWWVFVAWLLCLAMCFVATVFLLKFGLLFGDVMAKDWMKAVLTAVILDLLFIQPIVVVILALVRSLRGPVKPAAHPSQFVMCAREPVMTFVVGD